MALFLEVQPGEAVRIGDQTTIVVEQKTGKRTRLRIDSPERVERVEAGATPAMKQPAIPPTPRPTAAGPAQGPRLTLPPTPLPA